MISLLKRPGALIPLILSAFMLGVFGLYLAGVIPPDPTGDEGTAAHLFQIWLVLEVVLIPLFAIRWLPREPKVAAVILALQILAVFVVCSPVFYFQL